MADADSKALHEEIFELLPWYANGSLGELEAARVVSHLEDCEVCREELGRCNELGEAVAARCEPEWSPGDENLQRVLARISEQEGGKASWLERLRERLDWQGIPQPARWALVAQVAAIAGLVLALGISRTPPPAAYETLSSGAPASGQRPRVQLVFAPDLSHADVRAIVTGVDGSIVSGPSPRGVYELALPDAEALAEGLEQLRSDPRVVLAEPLSTGRAR